MAPDPPNQAPKIGAAELKIERFTETAEVRNFDCGDSGLNDFLTTAEVRQYEDEGLGKTYLVFWETERRLVAYLTISSESLRLEYLRSHKSFSRLSEMQVKEIPGIKIGRLGVQREFKRRGIGTHLLRYVAGLALETAAAARILFLEAYPESVAFYEGFGFLTADIHREKHRRNRTMVFDMYSHPEREFGPR